MIGRETYPNSFSLFRTDWQEVQADIRGLVDVADRTARVNPHRRSGFRAARVPQ